jgi:hypothetical protein
MPTCEDSASRAAVNKARQANLKVPGGMNAKYRPDMNDTTINLQVQYRDKRGEVHLDFQPWKGASVRTRTAMGNGGTL